jgi:hypothetical protein
VKRIRQIFEETGHVIQPSPEVKGRPTLLDWMQGMVRTFRYMILALTKVISTLKGLLQSDLI